MSQINLIYNYYFLSFTIFVYFLKIYCQKKIKFPTDALVIISVLRQSSRAPMLGAYKIQHNGSHKINYFDPVNFQEQ